MKLGHNPVHRDGSMSHGARRPSSPFAMTGDVDTSSDEDVEFQSLPSPQSVQLPRNIKTCEPPSIGDELRRASQVENPAVRTIQQFVARSNSGLDAARPPKSRVLSTVTLVALSFFAVGSGPEGGEAVIVAAGPLLGLIALVLFPVVYFFPMAFMVTELVEAIPEAGGHAYWVALAFGPVWGLQAGFWAWVGNCMHCATYASIAIAAIYRVLGLSGMPVLQYTARAGFSMLLAMSSFFHLRAVGYVAGTLVAFILVPFALIAVWSAIKADSWEKLGEIPDSAMRATSSSLGYGNLVTALVWNFNGFQNLSVFAKCVQDPPRTFRRVMFVSLWLIPLSYLAPILPVIALCEPDWTSWTGAGSGIYGAGRHLGGSLYTVWITVVALLCEAGLYIGGLLCSVYLACGMAEKSFAPFSLDFVGTARSNSSGIDHSVIFCSLAVILIVLNIEMKEMMIISNALSGLETMALIAAAVRLRVALPDLPRSTSLFGGSKTAMAAGLAIPFAVSAFVVGWAFTELIPAALTGVFLFGGVIYGLQSDLKDFRHTYEPVRTNSSF